MKRIKLGIICALFSIPAFAAEGRWTEGFGQGNLEYFFDIQGMRFYIGCPTQNGSADLASSVSLQRIKDSKDVPQFTITVNGHTFDGPFTADSRVGENNFIALLTDLRKGDTTIKAGSTTLNVPKSNAAKVLPNHGKKGFACNLG